MQPAWARDLTVGPILDRYSANWPREDAREPEPEPVPLPRRALREPEDDPRAEFVGAYLDRPI